MNDDNDTPQYAVPIVPSNPVTETQKTTTAFQSSKVPNVRTTLPIEDINEQENALPRSLETSKLSTDASAIAGKRQRPCEDTQPKISRQNTYNTFVSASKARKFHLVRSSSPISSPFSISKKIAQKRRNKRRKDLAIFAERPELIHGAKRSGDILRHGSDEPRNVDNATKKNTLQLEQPRKRPNATAAERKWRTETWANAPKPNEVDGKCTRTAENINEPSSQWNYESIRLAEQLQGVALAEIRASEEGAKGPSGSGQLKVKPKPPKPRQSRTEKLAVNASEDDIMTDAINLGVDDDYVLDTYIRSSAQSFEVTEPANLPNNSLHGMNHGKVGILIIEDEEEEALWEAFAEDQESDLEWNSEEEDENGL